jgi:hypothetical protein
MRLTHCALWAAVLSAGLVLLGCGGRPEPVPETDPNAVSFRDVRYLGLAYIDYMARKQKVPRSFKDLDLEKFPVGKLPEQEKDGRFVVVWNAPLVAAQTAEAGAQNDKIIIGHEKNAAVDGGWVLFGGGKVKKLTAEEFQKEKAPKPKVKSYPRNSQLAPPPTR